jgi:ABC-type nitrate/sulfonate/bicarbonate transport system substrate-binding protein
LLTFGVVYPFSAHRHLLRKWLSSFGINPDNDVCFVVVPPAQMVANLKAGHLDGFCVGEPWNSVAVQSRAGWCVSTSAELCAGHPEKVLMVRREFVEKRESEHLALVAALLEACEFCDAPQNITEIISLCSRPEYVAATATALHAGVSGQFDFGHGISRTVSDFFVFHRNNANEPSDDKAAWALEVVRSSGLCHEPESLSIAQVRRIFRTDIYDQALRLVSVPTPA